MAAGGGRKVPGDTVAEKQDVGPRQLDPARSDGIQLPDR